MYETSPMLKEKVEKIDETLKAEEFSNHKWSIRLPKLKAIHQMLLGNLQEGVFLRIITSGVQCSKCRKQRAE